MIQINRPAHWFGHRKRQFEVAKQYQNCLHYTNCSNRFFFNKYVRIAYNNDFITYLFNVYLDYLSGAVSMAFYKRLIYYLLLHYLNLHAGQINNKQNNVHRYRKWL
jgi:hypothetical protein